MNSIAKYETLRFYLHWSVFFAVGIWGLLAYGWAAGLGIAAMTTGGFNVAISLIALLHVIKQHRMSNGQDPTTESNKQGVFTRVAVLQFAGTAFIIMLGFLLALVDPLMSSMFAVPIALGSLVIIGGLCSILLVVTGTIVVVKRVTQQL